MGDIAERVWAFPGGQCHLEIEAGGIENGIKQESMQEVQRNKTVTWAGLYVLDFFIVKVFSLLHMDLSHART